jgi:hypothetical protein
MDIPVISAPYHTLIKVQAKSGIVFHVHSGIIAAAIPVGELRLVYFEASPVLKIGNFDPRHAFSPAGALF